MSQKEIVIKSSKKKVVGMFVGSLIFVAIGIWLIVYTPKTGNHNFFTEYPEYKITAGILGVAFFGVVAIMLLRKIIQNPFGVKITDEGVYDNSTVIFTGLIKWEDILDIREYTVTMGNKFVMIKVKNPEYIIELQKTFLMRKAAKANFDMSGTPVNITANGLECSHDELLILLKAEFEKHKEER